MTDGSTTEIPPPVSQDVHPLGRSALVISWMRLALNVVGVLVVGLMIMIGLRVAAGGRCQSWRW
jgi:hypothetical protein